jgi:4-amino-4-deoxy-L-arabinose transferase-like glycosyltransferase
LNSIEKHANTVLILTAVFSVILLGGFAIIVLQGFPNSADEYAYIFQSETFLQKRLWNEPHPAQEFFSFAHIAQMEGKWVSRFPPGWPLVMTIGSLFKTPLWFINPFLGMLSILTLFALARRIYNSRVAIVSVASMLFSSFFIFNSASYFSHTLCGLLILLFFYYELRFVQENKMIFALAAGFFLGFAFITRYYSTLLCAIPIGLHFLLQRDTRKLPALLWTFLGSAPFLLFTLFYNYKITGNALLFVTTWMDPNEKLGFVDGYSWNLAWIHLVKHLQSFTYWTAPPILFLYFAYVIHSIKNKSIRPYDLTFISIIGGYLFWHTFGGNQYGPRFYYEAYPFLILFVVARLFDETPFVTARPFQRVAMALFMIGFVWGACAIPFIAKREHRIISERMDLYRLVARENVHDAIIILRSGTGVTRPMPARDLARNGIEFQNDVLYARDLGAKNAELNTYFPNRKFYMYHRRKNQQNGRLIALEQN